MSIERNAALQETADMDLLANCGISKLMVWRMQCGGFTRLSQFDGMSDVDMLRCPNVSSRAIREIRAAQRRRQEVADQPAAQYTF